MREIKIHRTGGKLNENLRLEADGDKYTVMVKAHGSWGPKFKLEFQTKEFSDETGGPDGLSDEVLLAILIDRVISRKNTKPADEIVIVKLEEALFWLSKRNN